MSGENDSEVEVTPEMIEAGKVAFYPHDVLPWADQEDVLAAVYRAMRSASPSQRARKKPDR